MFVKYIKTPSGQMDEQVMVAKNIRTKDQQTNSVILDFKKQQVLQCSLNGVTAPKNWHKIVGFYHQYYASTIDQLCAYNGYEFQPPGGKDEAHPTD